MGHYSSECYYKQERRANFVKEEEKEDDGLLLLACKEAASDKESVWYLDTGASNHMCGRKEMFTKLNEIVKGKVSFGDNSKILVKGNSTILIHLKNGAYCDIPNFDPLDIYEMHDFNNALVANLART